MRGCVNVHACAHEHARVRAHRCIDVRAMRYRDREGARWGGAERRRMLMVVRDETAGGESIERGRVGTVEREA